MNGLWQSSVSRRLLLSIGALAGASQAARLLTSAAQAQPAAGDRRGSSPSPHDMHDGMITPGAVDYVRNGFDPHDMLTDWDVGKVSKLPDGRTLREFEITAEDKEIEIAPGLMFPAWTYNGRVPGPTLRAMSTARASPPLSMRSAISST